MNNVLPLLLLGGLVLSGTRGCGCGPCGSWNSGCGSWGSWGSCGCQPGWNRCGWDGGCGWNRCGRGGGCYLRPHCCSGGWWDRCC